MNGLMKINNPNGFTVSFNNPYPESTVKDLLEKHLLIPRKIRHFLRIKKHILINHQMVNWQNQVQTGDHITLIFDEEDYPSKAITFGDPKLVDCLYQDEHLIVVNKPEGMKSHANQPDELALLNHVSAYVGKTCYIIHRLDKETSGTILFAKNPFILPIMNRMLENRDISRTYWAFVSGTIKEKKLTIQKPIGRHRHDRRKRVVDMKQGQKAITIVKKLKNDSSSFTLVECHLKTGRTHQIRVHMYAIGHPLKGDPLYAPHLPYERLMLHAQQLEFTHPLNLETIRVKAKSDSFEKGLP